MPIFELVDAFPQEAVLKASFLLLALVVLTDQVMKRRGAL